MAIVSEIEASRRWTKPIAETPRAGEADSPNMRATCNQESGHSADGGSGCCVAMAPACVENADRKMPPGEVLVPGRVDATVERNE